MKCVKLNQNDIVDEHIPAYDDLFSRNLEKKMIIVEILRKNLKERKKILDQTWSLTANETIGPGEPENPSIFCVLQYIRLYMNGINIYIFKMRYYVI